MASLTHVCTPTLCTNVALNNIDKQMNKWMNIVGAEQTQTRNVDGDVRRSLDPRKCLKVNEPEAILALLSPFPLFFPLYISSDSSLLLFLPSLPLPHSFPLVFAVDSWVLCLPPHVTVCRAPWELQYPAGGGQLGQETRGRRIAKGQLTASPNLSFSGKEISSSKGS